MTDWVDVSVQGSAYQQELHMGTGKHRHRWYARGEIYGDWINGPAPRDKRRREPTGPHPDPTEALLAKAAKVADLLWDEFCPGIRRTPKDDEHYMAIALKVVELVECPP